MVGLGEKIASTIVEEGMRVGIDRTKYAIEVPLPTQVDTAVSLMTVEERRAVQ